jgi:HPr kinase/phosphorylase
VPVTVDRFLKSCAEPLRLRLVSGAGGLSREITDKRVQKTGLGITGEVDSTHPGKIQILGETEITYFRNQSPPRQARIVDLFFSQPMACAVAGGSLPLPSLMVETAERRKVPLLVSDCATSDLISEVLRHLERMFVETATIHGVLLDIMGVGVALLGKSGVGKSECALDLILRGHRFVSDDVIYLEKRGPETLLGEGEDMTRHHGTCSALRPSWTGRRWRWSSRSRNGMPKRNTTAWVFRTATRISSASACRPTSFLSPPAGTSRRLWKWRCGISC